MGGVTYKIEKTFTRAAGVVLIVAVAADAYDGTKDFSFKGAPNVISALASATSSGDNLNAPLVANNMSGPAYWAIPPETNRFFVLKST